MDPDSTDSERINRMDALLFAIALEEVLLQMRVHEGSTELRLASKALDETGQMQYKKLVRDRMIVKNTIRQTLIDIAENGKWSSLQHAVETFQDRVFSAEAKRKNHEKLKMIHQETSNELTAKRTLRIAKLRNDNHKMAFLRDKIKDDQLNANIRLRYGELWLSAPLEALELQHHYELRKEPPPRPDYELRVHEEITKAIELQIQEREKAVEYWQVRYASDIVSINERVSQKGWQLAAATTRRGDMQKLYDLREGEMRAWRSFKEQRTARLAREERIRNAATYIQSWWRGIMVRKALGPFKFLRNIKKSPSKSKKK